METTDNTIPLPKQNSALKWAKRLFQFVMIALVAWGIWHSFEKAQRDLAAKEFHWSDIRPLWLVLSGMIYFAATLPGWWFWHLTLLSLGQRPRPLTSLRAYTLGQLGKYVPGKALVVVLRATGVSGPQVDWLVAAAAVFIETLTLIAVGGVVSGVLLVFLFRRENIPVGWLLVAVALALLSWLPTVPAIFRFLVARLQRRSTSTLNTALSGLNGSLILRGWAMMPMTWLLMGLSLWAASQAVPGQHQQAILPSVHDLSLHTACIALAVVLGFASFIPGGFGARELVVTKVLALDPNYDDVRALVVAILLRIVWLLSELCVSAILIAFTGPRTAQPLASSEQQATNEH